LWKIGWKRYSKKKKEKSYILGISTLNECKIMEMSNGKKIKRLNSQQMIITNDYS